MDANQGLAQVRTMLGFVGMALILVGLAKMFGMTGIPIKGEYWQIMIAGFCAKAI